MHVTGVTGTLRDVDGFDDIVHRDRLLEVAGRSESTTLGLAFAIMDGVGALGALLGGIAGSYDLRYAFVFAAAAAASSVLLTLGGLHVASAERPAQ